MPIKQEVFFDGLGFEPIEFEYGFGKRTCYKAPTGGYWRIDYFSNIFVIEFAETEEEARQNFFDDGDTYEYLNDDRIIEEIRTDLIKFSKN